MKPTKGTPTTLNLSTLHNIFGGKLVAANRLEATSIAGLRRCFAFGLVEVDRAAGTLHLTELGCDALCGYAFDAGTAPHGSIKTSSEYEAERRAENAAREAARIAARPSLTLISGGVR